jgi:RNA polymerase sigma-70 factor, ECF subfamily
MSNGPASDPWYRDFNAVYQRFFGTIRCAAHRLMSPKLRRRVDADDVAQSVFREFYQRDSDRQCDFENTTAVRSYLWAIMANKVRNAAQFHRAAKRNVMLEESAFSHVTRAHGQSRLPPSDQWVAVADEVEYLTRGFSPRDLEILRLSMEGHGTPHIADAVGCSRWTVRRVLDLLGARLALRWRTVSDH